MSSGAFDHVFDKTDDKPGGKAFRIIRMPTPSHYIGGGQPVLTRADLEHASCPACYRPMLEPAPPYCPKCVASGADERHRANRAAGW